MWHHQTRTLIAINHARRRATLGAAAALLCVAFLISCRPEKRARETFAGAPVILISVDTLRADHLPAYGYPGVSTPAIDALRRDGVLFENAYSHCPMTLPAHVSMLTGLLPHESGVRNNLGYRFDAAKHETLPQALAKRGYATGAAVSSYVLRGETGLRDAFQFYEDAIPVATSGAVSQHQRPGATTLDVSRQWIETRGASPFFFMFHLYEPHAPYAPPEPFRTRYAAQPYDGEVAAADAVVGEFLAFLKQRGIYDRAIIILTSDHGEGLWEHGEDQHGILLYREVLHVPMIVKLPNGVRRGATASTPVQLVDIFPTVASLTGTEAPQLKGMSMIGLLDEKQPPPRRIYSETYYPRIHLGWSELRSLIDATHHYIHGPKPELYDIVRDPGEKKDVARDARRAAASMRDELSAMPAELQALQGVDPEDAAKLEALGYLGSVHATGGNAALPNPRDMLPYLARIKDAFKLADQRRLADSAVVLRQLVKENPGLFDVWDKLGEVLTEMGDYDGAVAVYRTAMARTQRFSPEMALSLADAQLRTGELDDAEKHAQLAMRSMPSNAHSLLAKIALARRDYAAAEREARAAIGSEKPQPTALLLLADVKRAEGNYPAALDAIRAAEGRARELNVPALYRLEFLRGDVLARMGEGNAAASAYEREIASFPQHTQAYANLAIIYFVENRPRDVQRILEAMVASNPHPGAYALAAKTLESLEDRPGAERWRARGEKLRR